MATKPTSPFPEFDVTKIMGEFRIPGLDMNALMDAQRKNIEAVTSANRLAFEGLQAAAARQADILRQSMEEAQSMVKEMMTSGTAEDRVAKQAELTKQAFERTLAHMKEVAEMIAKSNTEAAEIINKRVSESLDEIKSLAVKK